MTGAAPLRIVELRAENVKRLKAIRVRPDGSTVIIAGDNGQGKTSLLDAIEMAFGGGRSIPAEPVRRGERKARIVADLGDIVVERTFTQKGTTLEVRSAAGVVQKSPQGILDTLCSKIAFDPLAFSRKSDAEQREVLQAALGIDFQDLDDRRSKSFDQRRDVNRDLKAEKARLAAMKHNADAPDKEVSVAELSEEMLKARNQIDANQKVRDEADRRETRVERVKDDILTTEEEIERLEAALSRAQVDLAEKQQSLTQAKADAAQANAAADAIVDPDLEPLRREIGEAESINQKVRQNRERDAVQKRVDELEHQSDQLTTELAAIDEEKQSRLGAADFPIPGLGFDDDGVTLGGISLTQASQAERLRVSIAIGAALNPRLRVMLIRDAALLDQKSMELVAQFADEHNCQLWLERVGDGDATAVVLEDGEVRA